MKKILITGAGSYIGVSFERYIADNYAQEYCVDTVDMIDGSWREKDFSSYDVIFHVAGIAHRKETDENAELYYSVNRDLAVETAKKAKAEGVSQFVFLSSMSIYGKDTGVITKETEPTPVSNYGKSKLEAENLIAELRDESFSIAILRPPMVYGEGCKGNYQAIVKIVKKLPFFPNVKNRRSMINVDNLSSFVEMAIRKKLSGVYFPQNRNYVSTKELAKNIAAKMDKKIYMSFLCGFAVFLFRPFVKKLKKAFGTLIYVDTEDFDFSYCVVDI